MFEIEDQVYTIIFPNELAQHLKINKKKKVSFKRFICVCVCVCVKIMFCILWALWPFIDSKGPYTIKIQKRSK